MKQVLFLLFKLLTASGKVETQNKRKDKTKEKSENLLDKMETNVTK